MTSKEKAQELVDKYLNNSFGIIKEYIPAPLSFAKECALIAVNEIIEELIVTDFANRFHYWQEVKKEIEKL